MASFLPWFAVLATFFVGYMIVKRYPATVVLFIAGAAMITFALICGVGGVYPKGVKPTGSMLFDIFEIFRSIMGKQISGVGLIIMVAGGYAGYMDKIGAARKLADTVIKPLKGITAPYAVMTVGFFIGSLLFMVIGSAAGLAMLLLVMLFPILRAAGVTTPAAAAVIACTAAFPMTPSGGITNLCAGYSGLDPVVYFVNYQLVISFPSLLFCCACQYFTQRYYDRKDAATLVNNDTTATLEEGRQVPLYYALMPLAPVVIMLIFSPFCIKGVKLNVVTALLVCWAVSALVEILRTRSLMAPMKDSTQLFKSMGGMFASVVALIICAEFFATGLKVTGLIANMIEAAKTAGFGYTGMVGVFTGAIGFVTALTGSGVASMTALAAIGGDVANGLGGSVPGMQHMLHLASCTLRPLSPVAGGVIAVAGATGMSPFALVRRTWFPMIASTLFAFVLTMILY